MIPTNLPFEFKRLQFLVRLTIAMIINKSQGQSLTVCCINLENPRFSYGQLYVIPISVLENRHPSLLTYQLIKSKIFIYLFIYVINAKRQFTEMYNNTH